MCPPTTASHTTISPATYVSSYYYSFYWYICRQSVGKGEEREGKGEESDSPLPRKHSAVLKNSIVPVKAAPSAFYISDFTRELWAAAGALTPSRLKACDIVLVP